MKVSLYDSRWLSNRTWVFKGSCCLTLQALNNRGRRPLHLACRSGHLDIAITLLENGADPSARDANGMQVSVNKYDVGVLCSKKCVGDDSRVETLASGNDRFFCLIFCCC